MATSSLQFANSWGNRPGRAAGNKPAHDGGLKEKSGLFWITRGLSVCSAETGLVGTLWDLPGVTLTPSPEPPWLLFLSLSPCHPSLPCRPSLPWPLSQPAGRGAGLSPCPAPPQPGHSQTEPFPPQALSKGQPQHPRVQRFCPSGVAEHWMLVLCSEPGSSRCSRAWGIWGDRSSQRLHPQDVLSPHSLCWCWLQKGGLWKTAAPASQKCKGRTQTCPAWVRNCPEHLLHYSGAEF